MTYATCWQCGHKFSADYMLGNLCLWCRMSKPLEFTKPNEYDDTERCIKRGED